MVKNINIKMYEDKDQDLIDFLEDKPATFIIKEALKLYMMQYQSLYVPTPEQFFKVVVEDEEVLSPVANKFFKGE